MGFRVNGKNLAVARLMPRGKSAEKRLKYVHVSSKGTCVITPHVVARVTLPEGYVQPFVPVVVAQELMDAIPRLAPEHDDTIELPQGEPAVTNAAFVVPQIDKCFPDVTYQTASFLCNGDLLRKLLTVACEVSKDADKLICLRVCQDLNMLRIDAYRQPGDQEFCGVLKGFEYTGNYIPGEEPSGTKIEKKPVQRAMMLKAVSGRKFRGEGE